MKVEELSHFVGGDNWVSNGGVLFIEEAEFEGLVWVGGGSLPGIVDGHSLMSSRRI